jgi:hypothetical protein
MLLKVIITPILHAPCSTFGKSEAKNTKRPCDTAQIRFYGKNKKTISCCYNDMILRLAIPPNENEERAIPNSPSLTDVLEQILIHAMKPALNGTSVDKYYPSDPSFRELIVCNKGDKGLLLPVVYGDYFDREEKW